MRKRMSSVVCLLLLLSWIQIGSPMASPVASAESDIPTLSGVPTNLTAKPRNSQVDLTWNPPAEEYPVITYKLYRSTNPAGPYTIVADVTETEYRDFGLDNGITYYYKVTSVGLSGESAPSAEAAVVPMAPFNAPTGLTAISGDGTATIRWNPVEGAASYDVKRSTENGRNYETIASGVTDLQYTDSTVSNGTRYYYVVSAANSVTASANSASVQVVPSNGELPGVPQGIEAVAGDAQVILTWQEASEAVSYTIKRGVFGSGQYETIASNVPGTTFQDAGLVNGVTYDYVILAVNAHGESYNSEPLAVTPADVVVVAKDGSGDFTTVQAAIEAAPSGSSKRHVIFIKDGEYREKLTVHSVKSNLSFVGESQENTVLVYNDNANTLGPDGTPMGTSNSSSIFIYPTDFIAKNLTIQNDSGQGTGQAVAAYVRADRAYFENVRFLGYQDTLFTRSGRHYYKSCFIEGDVDFIFGEATAVFDQCQINSKRNGGMLTAASTPEDKPFGYVFLNSEITSDEGIENVYLGRPWRPYAAVAFIDTMIDESIAPYGWNNWSNSENEKTARYSEYNSRGPGANPKARAGWTKQLTPEEASQYTVQNVLKGSDDWNPLRVGVIPLSNVSAPVITLDQSGTVVNTSVFTVSGRVDKEAAVTVNGQDIALESDRTFSTSVELGPGDNIVSVNAVEPEKGLAATVQLRVVYDIDAPVIELDEPEGQKQDNSYCTTSNPYPVSGRLNEEGTVWINGQEIKVSGDLTFKTEVTLQPGSNEITVTAADMAGNTSGQLTIKVVLKGNIEPTEQEGPLQVVEAVTTDAHTIEVTFNSKLNVFDETDFQLLSAMGDWESLNPDLTPNLTVTEVSTRLNNSGQTVAAFKIAEALNPDGTFTKMENEDPRRVPYLKASYYSGDREKDIQQADYLISWQMDHGGWDKNKENTDYRRMWDGTEPKSGLTNNGVELGTFDNSATVNEILFLALVYKEYGYEPAKASALKGIDYVFASQYETGGWPQIYPARGNYSDYVTFNDNVMIRVMNLLTLVAEKKYPFNTDLVDDELGGQAKIALDLGLDYILKSQIRVDGVLTAWCAQHDPTTYEPREARSYEHPSISGSESVGIIKYLMSLPNPSTELQAATDAALNYLDEVEDEGIKYVHADPNEIYFYEDPNSSTWYRFYEIGTNRPIYSGRDGVVKYSILEIEKERRDGYRWAGEWPKKLLEVARTTGYYENRVYIKVVGNKSSNSAGETLEIGQLIRVEAI
ncbi:pectate lyase [Paenibacillus tarimensis]